MKNISLLLGMFLLLQPARAQEVAVSGKVTNQRSGEPLPGVNVVVKGTTTGTATDGTGSYRVSVPSGAVLVFSYIGFTTEEVPVGNQSTIDVGLVEDLKTLTEVVVVGYGSQKRQDVSTAITSVGAEAIERQPVASFEQTLQGQAPGVQVTSPTGAPGSAINVRIRGNNSISLTNSPLYIIDGVPILPSNDQELTIGNQRANPLATLNPNDIASVDILKDGAAAAIYGSRAANGVVVITTKRGKAGKAQVGFSAYYGVQQLRKKIDLLDGRQFAQFYNDASLAAGEGLVFNPDTVTTSTDWQDLIYQSAPIQNYQFNVSGGSERTQYYLSGAYFDQDGIVINSGYKRYSLKLNLDQQISNRFRVGTSLNLSRGNRNGSVRSETRLENGGSILGALAQIPTMPVYRPDGRYALNPFTLSDNPVGAQLETSNLAVINQLIGNLYGELDLLRNLTFRTSLGLDFRGQVENEFVTRQHPGTLNAASADRGSARTGTNQETIWLWENTLTYKLLLAEKHDFTFLLGNSVQASDRFTSNASVSGFASNAVPYLFAGTKNRNVSSFADEWGLSSYYGRILYNFNNKYLATASLRADGSSRFAAGNRFGFFPAVSLGWRLSEETFFPQTNLISDVKLRISAAANGNQEIGRYARFSTYGTGQNYVGAGGIVGGIGPNSIGNRDLKWETTYQYNLGLDVGLLAGRVNLTADAYLKRTQDLLTNVALPSSTSFTEVTQNVGQVENKGFELGINSTNVQTAGGFNWTTGFNFTLNRNRVLETGQVINAEGQSVDRDIFNNNYGYAITRRGQPIGVFYGYQVAGIFQNGADVEAAAEQPNAAPGDLRFADLNGDGVINPQDRTIIGNPQPDFLAGLTNTLSYKGFDLSFFFQGSFGNDIYNENRTSASSNPSRMFGQIYVGINRANAVIKYVPAISMPAERRNQILGEAHFLRALNYFNLVRLYGGVPLRLEPVESGSAETVSVTRSGVEQVYDQIIGDLAEAERLTAETYNDDVLNRARAIKPAVYALQAKVHLTRRQWNEAVAAAGRVIDSGRYTLQEDFASLFPPNNQPESIFEIQFSGEDDGGFTLPDLNLPSPPATYSFAKFNIPTQELISSADTVNDKRWRFNGQVIYGGRNHVSYLDKGPGTGNYEGYFVFKHNGAPNFFNSADNYVVLRLADVLLMYAEAANEGNGPSTDALDKLNQVRRRADLPALSLTDLPGKQAFRNEVDRQRRLELAFEGERWFDLLRYQAHESTDPAGGDHLVTALDIIAQKRGNRDPNFLLLPIPLNELNNNPRAEQNPGY